MFSVKKIIYLRSNCLPSWGVNFHLWSSEIVIMKFSLTTKEEVQFNKPPSMKKKTNKK